MIISTEKIIDHDEIRKNPERTAIPYFMVNAVVEAPFGAHPGNMPYLYDMDVEHYKEYINYCKTGEGIKEYFNKFFYNVPDNDGYLKLIGEERLEELKRKEQIRYKYREE